MPQASSQHVSTTKGNTKTIMLRKGDSLTLTYTGDIFDMDTDDRELVLQLLDLMKGYAQEIANGNSYDESMEEGGQRMSL